MAGLSQKFDYSWKYLGTHPLSGAHSALPPATTRGWGLPRKGS
jgi:hypothetical protein